MKVFVYVEGPSDKLAMENLLRSLIETKSHENVHIRFIVAPKGNKKKAILEKVPVKAASILRNDPDALVVAMPDLYPKNTSFQHETVDELREGVTKNFERALKKSKEKDDPRLRKRFRVFCFKHDLEALILAAKDALQKRLGTKDLKTSWRVPVENQNHDHPPKRVVESLFKQFDKSYQDTIDAPSIMGNSDYRQIAKECPQCFAPFVQFLSNPLEIR
jgi:hypothetical protein